MNVEVKQQSEETTLTTAELELVRGGAEVGQGLNTVGSSLGSSVGSAFGSKK